MVMKPLFLVPLILWLVKLFYLVELEVNYNFTIILSLCNYCCSICDFMKRTGITELLWINLLSFFLCVTILFTTISLLGLKTELNYSRVLSRKCNNWASRWERGDVSNTLGYRLFSCGLLILVCYSNGTTPWLYSLWYSWSPFFPPLFYLRTTTPYKWWLQYCHDCAIKFPISCELRYDKKKRFNCFFSNT